MPYALRDLFDEGHKILWDHASYVDTKCDLDSISIECLADLQVKGKGLSLWLVENETDPNIKLLAAALRSMRWPIKNFEYVLFDVEAITKANISLEAIHKGQMPSKSDALKEIHRDIMQLTIGKLIKLIEAVWETRRTGMILKDELETLIIDGINSGEIVDTKDRKINPDLRKNLANYLHF